MSGSPYVDAPEVEASWIVGCVMDRPWSDLLYAPEPMAAEDRVRAIEIADRRSAGEPLQYLLGDAYFHSLRFLCDPRALIPRPETELLVTEAEHRLADREARVADVGTGSGCISVAVAKELPRARITATDVSADALALAGENARLHGVSDRIDFRCGDLFAPLTEAQDAILMNPPYIATDDIDQLGPELAAEPRIALDGGPDGMDFHRAAARLWRDAVVPGGFFACEVGLGQMSHVIEMFGAASHAVVCDLSGIARAFVAENV
jgi:release factor glutamine methyltransferase